VKFSSVLAATSLAAATLTIVPLAGHAGAGSTESYVAASPTGGGSCSPSSAGATGADAYSSPNVGAVCWLLSRVAGQARVEIDDAVHGVASGTWELVTWPDDGAPAQADTLLADGDLCGSASIAIPAAAKELVVSLGGTAVHLPNGWLASVGSTAPCPSPVHGTATATLP
jgi:hypothetical protein